MKTTRVNRYNCDHCGTKKYSAPHMTKHERGCTMNPDRTCGVCNLLEEHQRPLAPLVAMLPDPSGHRTVDEFDLVSFDAALTADANKALEALRDEANNCPACILAAIRQRGIPVPMVTDFDFSAEMRSVWSDVNERAMDCYYG